MLKEKFPVEKGRFASPLMIVERFTPFPIRSNPAVLSSCTKRRLPPVYTKRPLIDHVCLFAIRVPSQPGLEPCVGSARLYRFTTVVSNGFVVSNSVTGVSSLKYDQRCWMAS